MKDILTAKTKEVNAIISPFFKAKKGSEALLADAMEYSLTAGGKRLRPMLMREASLLYGVEDDALHHFMAAIEMIHTYSLIHDDLPAMDNDDIRHGKKATHVMFGEAHGILAGDGLLNFAYEICAECADKYLEKRVIHSTYLLADAAGARGMAGGQSLDVTFDQKEIHPDEDEINFIYKNKTGALIRAALEVGGTLGGGTREECKSLRKIGDNIGFAFQIEDDILDIVGDAAVLGKPTGSDSKNEKYTYVHAFGMDKSKKKIMTLTEEAKEILKTLPGDHDFLLKLFDYLTDRDK